MRSAIRYLLPVLLALFAGTPEAHGQDPPDFVAYRLVHAQFKLVNGYYSYDINNDDHQYVGDNQYQTGTPPTTVHERYRAAYAFDLNQLPRNINVTKVRFDIKLTLTSSQDTQELYDLKLYNSTYGDVVYGTAEERYDAVVSGALLHTWAGIPRYATQDLNSDFTETHPVAAAVEAAAGGPIAFSFCSGDEGISGIHIMDMKKAPNTLPSSAISIQIWYDVLPPDVTLVNEFGASGASYDFEVDSDDQQRYTNGVTLTWEIDEEHNIAMVDHDAITHTSDSRPYDRESRLWKKSEDGAVVASNAGAAWTTSADVDATYTANFWRHVDNQFYLWNLNLAGAFSGIDIESSEGTLTNGQTVTKRETDDADNNDFTVTVPFTISSGGKTYYMVKWTEGSAYGEYDEGGNAVTLNVSPNLHHKDLYNNPYRAMYNYFSAYNEDSKSDVSSSVNINIGTFDAQDDELTVTVDETFVSNGITYNFIG